MIKTLGELKKEIVEVIINHSADRISEVLYFRQYTSDPLYVIEIRAIHNHEFEKDDELGNECHAHKVPTKILRRILKEKKCNE